MPNTTNKNLTLLVTELVMAWNIHDIEAITTFYAPDYEGTDVSEASPHSGLDGIRQSISRYLQAFPDLHFTSQSIITQKNQVALKWTAQGTHQGTLMRIPPTGRAIEVQGVSLLTIVDGKIKSASYIWDVAGLLRNVGLLPEL